ncbi:MAG: hypothetical protein ACP5OR_01895 [Candidatus Dormibacteria bacterium]
MWGKKTPHQLIVPLSAEIHVETPEENAERQRRELMSKLGDQYCSARGCKEETGLSCEYLDRRDRPCPTAWCPEHRHVVNGHVYCPSHAGYVEGTESEFGAHVHPDVENRVPALVNWVTRELDADVLAMIEPLVPVYGDKMVIDPIRFVLFGVERIRTWERSWKMCSHISVDLRVALAVEESRPDTILGKVNSHIVITTPAPWSDEYQYGTMPATPAEAEAEKNHMRMTLLRGLYDAVQDWAAHEPPAVRPVQEPPPQTWPQGNASVTLEQGMDVSGSSQVPSSTPSQPGQDEQTS